VGRLHAVYQLSTLRIRFAPKLRGNVIAAELIGTATSGKDGLMSKDFYNRTNKSFSMSMGKLYKFALDYSAIFNIKGDGANSVFVLCGGNLCKYARLCGPLTADHYSVFKDDDNNFYIKYLGRSGGIVHCLMSVTEVAFEESDADTSTLTQLQ